MGREYETIDERLGEFIRAQPALSGHARHLSTQGEGRAPR